MNTSKSPTPSNSVSSFRTVPSHSIERPHHGVHWIYTNAGLAHCRIRGYLDHEVFGCSVDLLFLAETLTFLGLLRAQVRMSGMSRPW